MQGEAKAGQRGGWAGSRLALTWALYLPCHRHIFLGFSKCGRYVLSYTSSSGDDDFSFYIYHLYWWEFNVHSKLKLVGPGPAPNSMTLAGHATLLSLRFLICKMEIVCSWGHG